MKRLASLKSLSASDVFFQGTCNWLHAVNMLPSLEHLDLHGTGLQFYPLPLINFTRLSYLDLSSNELLTTIPEWIFNLTSLQYLSLSDNGIDGSLPSAIGNLRLLEFLDLSWYSRENFLKGRIPENLTSLCKLKILSLSGMNISSKIEEFRGIFSGCMKNSLESLDTSYTNLSSYMPSWLGNINNLRSINLNGNGLRGLLPAQLTRSLLLDELLLSGNTMSFRTSPGDLKNLRALDLSSNSLSGVIPDSLGDLKNLRRLYLSGNSFQGSVPDSLGSLLSLQELKLDGNQLNGTVAQSLGELSNLVTLDLRGNSLGGVLTELHFAHLTKLKYLDISSNALILKVGSDWIPPFQLEIIRMKSCRLGPRFPRWLQTQANLSLLDLSSTGISDTVPDWLWNIAPGRAIFTSTGNRTSNRTQDGYPRTACLDLSNNSISGNLPQTIGKVVPSLQYLYLSKNNLSGRIPSSLCDINGLNTLDLTSNSFSGDFPSCKFSSLGTLKVSNNNISGGIHSSTCSFPSLYTLHLNGNSLSEEFPLALKDCFRLQFLDLGHNKIRGEIPTWIGESLPSLQILSLRYNKLTGTIPSKLGLLGSLQILDLSHNRLAGAIPKSFGNLSAMQFFQMPEDNSGYAVIVPADQNIFLLTKRVELEYDTLFFVNILDLSDNSLSGSIPEELANLTGLLSLNLSGNYLTGTITERIGELKQLESLDLSRNELSGNIPSNLAALNFLGSLNLSYNNLSGRIPTGSQLQTLTVDASIYIGNPELCGIPLAKICPGAEKPTDAGNGFTEDGDHSLPDSLWLYFGMAAGFLVGWWVLCGVLVLKGTWRVALFRFADEIWDRVYATMSACLAKLERCW